MIIIGSNEYMKRRSKKDVDIIMNYYEFVNFYSQFDSSEITDFSIEPYKYCHFKVGSMHYEIHLVQEDEQSTNAELLSYCENEDFIMKNAPINVLYCIKMSHRFKKDSKHFHKTMADIKALRSMGANMDDPVLYEIFKRREIETYNYSHPVLDTTKSEFFDKRTVNYVYDHDSIHECVKMQSKPAYSYYMKDGAQVMTDEDKFKNCPERIKLMGVYEESCVLALERSQIPSNFSINPEVSFKIALEKVCTSITSGWFREYAWENYKKVMDIYVRAGKDDYVKRFKNNSHLLKPFEEKV